ncbi:MAG: CHAP domain-containing protein [Clostridiales bacterium]|nr:CHAP domain-containing protein [Clostridiales bacterium]
MKNIVNSYVRKFLTERRKSRRAVALLLALALVVASGVSWRLHSTGIAMTNETYCGLEEHTHTEDCYAKVLVCGKEESEGHTHTEDCYDEEGNLTCGQEESAGHTHTDACYEEQLVCDKEEHTHTVSCLTDLTADVETASDWKATLPKLTGDCATDVAAIAKSQIGYAESTANFTLAEDGTTRKGYTRYGEWYGNEYGDWDAMFASFCLHYAGVDEDDFPQASGAYAWISALNKLDLYEDADYTAAAGDLVFFDTNKDGKADHVGVVIDVNGTTLTAVEGDSNDKVEKNTYSLSDSTITGYGALPEQETDAAETETYTAADGDVTVTVTAPKGALPEGAELSVTLFDEDSEEYAAAGETVAYDAADEDTGMAAMDISFTVNGVEVEPTEAVTVSIDASALLPEEADAGTIEVQHLAETDAGVEPVLVADATEDTAGTVDTETAVVEFEVESFSSFTITWSGGGSGGPNSTSYSTSVTATAYVYGSSTELSVSNISLDSGRTVLFDENNSNLAISGYTLYSASLTYGGTTYSNVTSLTVTITSTTSSGQTTTTYTYTITYTVEGVSTTKQLYSSTSVLSSTAIQVYLYYMPTVTLTAAASSSSNYDYTLTATPYGFTGTTVTYTWEVSDEAVATVSGSGSTATFAWTESAKAGDTVTVTVTAYDSSTGQTATATYVLIYEADSVTFTVYYPSGTDSDGNTAYSVASNATVYVYDSDGNLVASGTTDSNGQVMLSLVDGETYNIVVGNYEVSGTTYY